MKLASSSYYYKPKSDVEGQACSDAELGIISSGSRESLRATVIGAWASSFAVRGSMSTTNGFAVCSDKYQLFPIRWQSFKIATTDSNHGHKVYPNLLAGLTLTGINQAWVADITYIRILKGFVYLAALLDRYSRKVIGWAISKRIDAELCLAALKIALDTPQTAARVYSSLRSRRAVCLSRVRGLARRSAT